MTPKADFTVLKQFVHTLIASGVQHVCFAPGSRSTPLILAFAEHPHVKLWQHIDERSAGFFALGIAKSTRSPVALLCTSGTAAANFFPAVIEARLGRVPLIVLTADRPHEARDNASPQTIDQIKLYGNHVKWFAEMPIPDGAESLTRHAIQQAARAAAIATENPAGPVHLNFPFREPLVREELFARPIDLDAPPLVLPGRATLDPAQVKTLIDELKSVEKGLIVCGPQDDPHLPDALTSLADLIDFPILADPLSGLRAGPHADTRIIDAYDTLLRDKAFVEAHRPELILRIGGTPASKPLFEFVSAHRGPHWLIDAHEWRDPYLSASHIVRADPADVCRALCEARSGSSHDLRPPTRSSGTTSQPSAWTSRWIAANRACRTAIDDMTTRDPALFEGRIFTELRRMLPADTTLFVGNSMPIRDLDTFFGLTRQSIRILANRGANGIDGVLSTALGVAAASLGKVVLVIGDLSFYHDMNALLMAKQYQLDLTVILVQNDGGGIFSFLPQADLANHFETLFGTPHGLSFKPLVEMFDGQWSSVPDWEAFGRALTQSLQRGGLHVIEVRTDRRDNVHRHRQIWREAMQSVTDLVNDPLFSGESNSVD